MAFTTLTFDPFFGAAARHRPRAGLILIAGMVFAICAWLMPPGPGFAALGRVGLGLTAGTLGLVAVWLMALGMIAGARTRRHVAAVTALITDDIAAALLSDAQGRLFHANPAAERLLGVGAARSLAALLRRHVANPGPLLFRMQTRATARGAAREDVVTREGHLQITVNRAGSGLFLWRVEKSADRPQRSADPMPLPMITVGRGDVVLFMNAAARELVGERARSLDRIFPRGPVSSGVPNDVTTRDGVIACLAVELEGAAGRREIFLLPGMCATERQPDGWAFFDELPVPLLKLSRAGEVQLSNRPARDLLGVAGCAGQTLGDLLEGPGRPMADWLDAAARAGGTAHSEVLRVRREDREMFAQVTLNRVQEAGETSLIAVLGDATELKTLEAQFVQSQKMQAIGQLAGGVAHDFNNLLTAITGHCDLLLLRHDHEDGDYADLMQISQNANRAAALVGQLLAYSRKQTLRPRVFDLRDTLADLTHLLNRLVGERVMLSLDHDPALWPIRADRRQLEQVLMNLVLNARDAMPDGGEIRITTENLTLDGPLRRDRAVVAAGHYVSVRVRDEGVGIPPDRIDKIFEPFYTTKRVGEGTGLGLSTAYGIIKQTGGFIFADSTPGDGSCFTLLLPAHEGEVIEADGARETAPQVVGSVSGVVLLVEDEAPVRAFASRALQMRGLRVLEAESAEVALEMLSDLDLRVDVFVTDVVMPGRDGPSWVSEALQQRPGTRVVFVSGYAEETLGAAQGRIANAVFLPKPFSLTELTDTVARQIYASGPPDTPDEPDPPGADPRAEPELRAEAGRQPVSEAEGGLGAGGSGS